MSFQLAQAFSPSYTVLKPEELADKVQVRGASWDSSATVRISNEPGRSFKVGFVQVLYESELIATYETNTLSREYKLPVLDSDPGMFPWYEDSVTDSPEVTGTNGDVLAIARIVDRPSSGLLWYLNGDVDNPLLNVKWRKKFKTWLVVRDQDQLPNSFAAVLAQFNYAIEASFNVFLDNAVGRRCVVATGAEKPNKPELVSPTTPIHNCIWIDRVANSSYGDVVKTRIVVKAGGPPAGPVIPGGNVRELAKLFNKK